jgi:unsaturated rhamnogalacturonyl hydrolase
MRSFTTILSLFLIISSVSLSAPAQPPAAGAVFSGRPYAAAMAETVMTIWKDSLTTQPGKPAKWTYDQGVILKGIEGLWKATADKKYFDYIRKSMDFFLDENGNIRTYKFDEYTLDNITPARSLLLLYNVTGQEKYLKAVQQLRRQLTTQPRTNAGGFWHKKTYPSQMWLDGLYMAEPFYTEYANEFHEDSAFNDIARQFILMEQNSRDAPSGLLYHGYDESRTQKWADTKTGRSPNFWARAMGWYGMALADVLEIFPDNHPKKKELVAIFNRFASAILRVQDGNTGLWWDILNRPGAEKNYREASASSMFVYALAKGIRLGYLPQSYLSKTKKAYDGIIKTFVKDENGQTDLYGTVSVSGLGGNPYRDGSFDYYMSEKVVMNDPKGMGAFILASNEMEMLHARNAGKSKTVLLDNFFNHELRKDATGLEVPYHYVWNEDDNGGFSFFKSAFERQGIRTATLSTAPTAASLANADIYIIVDPDTEKETRDPHYLQSADIEAIATWVRNGGVLLIMGNDAGNAEFEHFNHLAEKFGIHFIEDSKNKVQGTQFEQGAIMIPAGHPIFKTTSKIYIKELSTVTTKTPASVALRNGDDNIIATAKFGKGTVIAIGDPWLYNEYVDGRKLPSEFQNLSAANDLIEWLVQKTKK